MNGTTDPAHDHFFSKIGEPVPTPTSAHVSGQEDSAVLIRAMPSLTPTEHARTTVTHSTVAPLASLHYGPCEEMFEWLAHFEPLELIDLIRSGKLSPGNMTFATEIAGASFSTALAAGILIPLLEHEAPLVREGAICGLAYHLDDSHCREAVKRVAGTDDSVGVRSTAQDALEYSA